MNIGDREPSEWEFRLIKAAAQLSAHENPYATLQLLVQLVQVAAEDLDQELKETRK